MNIDDYDVMIEKAKEDLKEAKEARDQAYKEVREVLKHLSEADRLVTEIKNLVAFYQELRENALTMGEDDED